MGRRPTQEVDSAALPSVDKRNILGYSAKVLNYQLVKASF
jgi:hypothetical protein